MRSPALFVMACQASHMTPDQTQDFNASIRGLLETLGFTCSTSSFIQASHKAGGGRPQASGKPRRGGQSLGGSTTSPFVSNGGSGDRGKPRGGERPLIEIDALVSAIPIPVISHSDSVSATLNALMDLIPVAEAGGCLLDAPCFDNGGGVRGAVVEDKVVDEGLSRLCTILDSRHRTGDARSANNGADPDLSWGSASDVLAAWGEMWAALEIAWSEALLHDQGRVSSSDSAQSLKTEGEKSHAYNLRMGRMGEEPEETSHDAIVPEGKIGQS